MTMVVVLLVTIGGPLVHFCCLYESHTVWLRCLRAAVPDSEISMTGYTNLETRRLNASLPLAKVRYMRQNNDKAIRVATLMV